MATSGDRYLATSGDFFMATDRWGSSSPEASPTELGRLNSRSAVRAAVPWRSGGAMPTAAGSAPAAGPPIAYVAPDCRSRYVLDRHRPTTDRG